MDEIKIIPAPAPGENPPPGSNPLPGSQPPPLPVLLAGDVNGKNPEESETENQDVILGPENGSIHLDNVATESTVESTAESTAGSTAAPAKKVMSSIFAEPEEPPFQPSITGTNAPQTSGSQGLQTNSQPGQPGQPVGPSTGDTLKSFITKFVFAAGVILVAGAGYFFFQSPSESEEVETPSRYAAVESDEKDVCTQNYYADLSASGAQQFTSPQQCKPIPRDDCEIVQMLALSPTSYHLSAATKENLKLWDETCSQRLLEIASQESACSIEKFEKKSEATNECVCVEGYTRDEKTNECVPEYDATLYTCNDHEKQSVDLIARGDLKGSYNEQVQIIQKECRQTYNECEKQLAQGAIAWAFMAGATSEEERLFFEEKFKATEKSFYESTECVDIETTCQELEANAGLLQGRQFETVLEENSILSLFPTEGGQVDESALLELDAPDQDLPPEISDPEVAEGQSGEVNVGSLSRFSQERLETFIATIVEQQGFYTNRHFYELYCREEGESSLASLQAAGTQETPGLVTQAENFELPPPLEGTQETAETTQLPPAALSTPASPETQQTQDSQASQETALPLASLIPSLTPETEFTQTTQETLAEPVTPIPPAAPAPSAVPTISTPPSEPSTPTSPVAPATPTLPTAPVIPAPPAAPLVALRPAATPVPAEVPPLLTIPTNALPPEVLTAVDDMPEITPTGPEIWILLAALAGSQLFWLFRRRVEFQGVKCRQHELTEVELAGTLKNTHWE